MATKKQLQQRVKELAEQLELLNADNEHHKSVIKELSESLARVKDTESQYWQWYQDEQRKAQYYAKGLRQLRYIMALDMFQTASHRERNELMRTWITQITFWLSIVHPDPTALDDIPF